MSNEFLLILTLLVTFGSVIIFHQRFGKAGLYTWTVIATISANIEVLILVDAFGMEMTLGNILFASNFLVTDILSELYGKKDAELAVNLGIATSFVFILISHSWLLYTPAAADWASESIHLIFENTPRLMLASFLVYAFCQRFDVFWIPLLFIWQDNCIGILKENILKIHFTPVTDSVFKKRMESEHFCTSRSGTLF